MYLKALYPHKRCTFLHEPFHGTFHWSLLRFDLDKYIHYYGKSLPAP